MAVLADLRKMSAVAEVARKDAQHEANQQSSAMQSRYDTFREEGQYLAGAQNVRKLGLDAQIASFEAFLTECQKRPVVMDTVCVGSLVTIADDDEEGENLYLLVPVGGGIIHDGVIVVSYEAPIAQVMFNKREGDGFIIVTKGRERHFTIVEVT
ncbi:MAG: GreA/GreB family elongation factor [Patescibacteria group bacterium]